MSPTYQQLDLLILVKRSSAKLLALCHRTDCPGCRYRRHRGRRSVTLEQDRHHRAFRLFYESELALAKHIDADKVSQPHLPGCLQVCQGERKMPLNSPFQVTRSILRIGAFRQQETL